MRQAKARLWTGDCMKILPRIDDGAARLVLTDPPYGIGYKSFKHCETVVNDDAPYIWWLREAWRILAPCSALFCFCRWDVEDTFKMAIKAAGFTIRGQAIWDKVSGGGMGDTRRTLAPEHEVILFAAKGNFTWPAGRPSTMFRFSKPRGPTRTHLAEKPVGLLAAIIQATTRPGDLVVDPFAGSGSTGEAAVRLGRSFVGVELDHNHARRARARITRSSVDAIGGGGQHTPANPLAQGGRRASTALE